MLHLLLLYAGYLYRWDPAFITSPFFFLIRLDWRGFFPLMFLHGYHGVLELLKTPFHSLTGLVLDDGL